MGRVEIVDYDTGVNAQYDLSILQSTPNVMFSLNGNDLRTTASLDRETINTYYVVVEAIDKGNPRLTGTGTLTVTVLDANDNAPFFNKTYQFLLSEHQTTGRINIAKKYKYTIGMCY